MSSDAAPTVALLLTPGLHPSTDTLTSRDVLLLHSIPLETSFIRPWSKTCGTEWRDTDLVFPNRVGGPMDNNKPYYREYKPLLYRAELEGEGFTFHALQHTFATARSACGEHQKVVQALLRHSSSRKRWIPTCIFIEDIGGDAIESL
jgi:integrase